MEKYEIKSRTLTLCVFEKLDFDPKLRLFDILCFADFFEKLDFDPKMRLFDIIL